MVKSDLSTVVDKWLWFTNTIYSGMITIVTTTYSFALVPTVKIVWWPTS